ncbi:MAG: hypothetical protein ACTTJ4_07170, partial [Treponema sp.]
MDIEKSTTPDAEHRGTVLNVSLCMFYKAVAGGFQMHKILEEDEENKNYGVRRMQIALEQRGIKRSLSTIRRAMARGNL